jgi:hypothetical protein
MTDIEKEKLNELLGKILCFLRLHKFSHGNRNAVNPWYICARCGRQISRYPL